MTNVQFIETEGQRAFAILPMAIWNRVAPLLEDLDDETLFEQAKARDDGARIPASVLDAELAGTHPVAAWREYRKLTQEKLASEARISKAYLSQIENSKRTGTFKVLAALAKALAVPVDILTS